MQAIRRTLHDERVRPGVRIQQSMKNLEIFQVEGKIMPIYEYRCDACGPFSKINKMENALKETECPYCGIGAKRIISPPFVACMTAQNRKAWEKNEKSAHEPRIKRRSCSCSGAHTCNSGSTEVKKPQLQQSKRQHARPWMLGH